MNLKCSAIRNVAKHADFLCWFVSQSPVLSDSRQQGWAWRCVPSYLDILAKDKWGTPTICHRHTHTHTLRGNHV